MINIGLPKTGNVSLAAVMRKLGWRSWHGGSATADDGDVRALLDGKRIPQWDFFTDNWILRKRIVQIVNTFPDTVVICTTRNFDDWKTSVIMHRKGAREGRQGIAQTPWSMGRESEAELLERFNANIEVCTQVMKQDCTFFRLDLGDPCKLDRLCDHLNVPVPAGMTWPEKNRGWWRK